MQLVKCISKIALSDILKAGKKYWMDESSKHDDIVLGECADIYLDEEKKDYLGSYSVKYFKTMYRYLNYGMSLTMYINTNTEFLLSDIIHWCSNNLNYQISGKLLSYIRDNNLNSLENMNKGYRIVSTPYNVFESNNKLDEYEKYFGYSLVCTD